MPPQASNPPTNGRLEVICGPMFSGKTTELIRRLEESQTKGLRVASFKPATDHRYSAHDMVSHSGRASPAQAVGDPREIARSVDRADVFAIDEAHFFGADLTGVCERLVRSGRRVIVAGLERDHFGRPFEPFPALLCEADEVVKLSGPCAVCGGPAVHSQRMVNVPGRIVVGGRAEYEPRCRACFTPARDG